jgi:tetratricopeptide (TPR) repeat protein
MASALETASMYRSNAQIYRKQAKQMREDGNLEEANRLFKDAVNEYEKAIRVLRRELRNVRGAPERGLKEECEHLRLLSQTHGSLGGTWRDARRFDEAIKEYDEGYRIEEERKQRCQDDDSYNLLQRLVVRILRCPRALQDSSKNVGSGLDVPHELTAACHEIERQVLIQQSRNDSWAKADLVLVRALLRQTVKEAISDLETANPDHSFYASTHEVIKSLLDEGLGRGQELGRWLQEFKLFLERRGGLLQ